MLAVLVQERRAILAQLARLEAVEPEWVDYCRRASLEAWLAEIDRQIELERRELFHAVN